MRIRHVLLSTSGVNLYNYYIKLILNINPDLNNLNRNMIRKAHTHYHKYNDVLLSKVKITYFR